MRPRQWGSWVWIISSFPWQRQLQQPIVVSTCSEYVSYQHVFGSEIVHGEIWTAIVETSIVKMRFIINWRDAWIEWGPPTLCGPVYWCTFYQVRHDLVSIEQVTIATSKKISFDKQVTSNRLRCTRIRLLHFHILLRLLYFPIPSCFHSFHSIRSIQYLDWLTFHS